MPTQARVSVPALCEFSHGGRSYVRGQMVNVSPATALALSRAKKVTLDVKTSKVVAAEANRKYATRDVKAEEPIAVPRTRRRYRRRDMQAEGE